MDSDDQRDVDALVTALSLEVIDRDLFRGHPPYWEQRRLFGGIVAAQALAAAYGTIEGTHVHSLHSYFLRPGNPELPVIYDVDRIRDGRSFATRRVVARQDGEAIFNLSASFHKAEEGFTHQVDMPDIGSADDAPKPEDFGLTQRDYKPPWKTEGTPIELRPLHNPVDWETGLTERMTWIRLNGSVGDDPVQHRLLLTYLSDFTLLGTSVRHHATSFEDMMVASLDHAMWFHRDFRADEWLLYATTTPSASGARGFNLGNFFTQDGILVASTAQEGLMRDLSLGR